MKKIKLFLPTITLTTLAPTILIASCGGNEDPEIDPEKEIEIVAPSTTLDIDRTMQLSAKFQDKPIDVTWSVDESKYATIDNNGLLKGIDGGKVKVTATSKQDPEYKGIIEITINGVAVKSVSITHGSSTIYNLDIEQGKTDTVTASVYPSNATNKNVTWSSDDDTVATISPDGKIEAKDLGVTSINVTTVSGQKTNKCQIKSYDKSLYQTRYQDYIGYNLWPTDKGKLAETVVIPELDYSVYYINNPDDRNIGAFENCSNLENLYLPDCFSRISSGFGARAFYGCTNLRNIYFDGNISDWKEMSAEKDWHVYVPADFVHCNDGISHIDEHFTSAYHFSWSYNMYDRTATVDGFEDGKETENVVIPTEYEYSGVKFKVTKIGTSSFVNKPTIKFVSIPYTVTNISGSAFMNCSNLSCVTLERGLTNIGIHAFYTCRNLETIIYRGTKEQFSKITLGDGWAAGTKATVVHCEDGEVTI